AGSTAGPLVTLGPSRCTTRPSRAGERSSPLTKLEKAISGSGDSVDPARRLITLMSVSATQSAITAMWLAETRLSLVLLAILATAEVSGVTSARVRTGTAMAWRSFDR